MRSVIEYLKLAEQYDADAQAQTEPGLKKRFADIAECYRLLAEERQKLVAAGKIESGANTPPQS